MISSRWTVSSPFILLRGSRLGLLGYPGSGSNPFFANQTKRRLRSTVDDVACVWLCLYFPYSETLFRAAF